MISKITLKNFRKYSKIELELNSSLVVIDGANAIGKTTILEAISLVSTTKSHRTRQVKDFFYEDCEFSIIEIQQDHTVFKIIISNLGKKVMINQVEVKKLSDYLGQFPTVFFSPNDLELITGSPGIRRKFLNQELSQIKHQYLKEVSDFQQILQERNTVLKKMTEKTTFPLSFLTTLTTQFCEIQKSLMKTRKSFIEELNRLLLEIHPNFVEDEVIELIYQPSLPEENLEKFYESKLKIDMQNQQTNYGVHRDDIVFLINGKDASKFGSQGQNRSFILSIKIALCKLIYRFKRIYPVLLLDDVLSELDTKRQNKLLQLTSKLGQTIITTTNVEQIDSQFLKNYQRITLT